MAQTATEETLVKKGATDTPVACVRVGDVFTPEMKKRRREVWGRMETMALGIDELKTGYAIRFPLEDSLFLDLAEFVTYERHCCPFLDFDLELKPDADEVRLRLTGNSGVKEFLSMELAPLQR